MNPKFPLLTLFSAAFFAGCAPQEKPRADAKFSSAIASETVSDEGNLSESDLPSSQYPSVNIYQKQLDELRKTDSNIDDLTWVDFIDAKWSVAKSPLTWTTFQVQLNRETEDLRTPTLSLFLYRSCELTRELKDGVSELLAKAKESESKQAEGIYKNWLVSVSIVDEFLGDGGGMAVHIAIGYPD